MSTQPTAKPLMVMEAGFKIIPGKESEFLAIQANMVPVAVGQPGFVSVYGGPILDSSWLYFGVRFDSQEQMNAWHHHRGHQNVQKMAYEKWWTAVYIRKWRTPKPGEALGDRLMCETRIFTTKPFNSGQTQAVRNALAGLVAAGAKRFETLNGDHEPQPYQFVGPLEIAPVDKAVIYSVITHWSDAAAVAAWQQSPAYKQLQSLGTVTSEVFVAVKETDVRDRVRDDRLQREWTLEVQH